MSGERRLGQVTRRLLGDAGVVAGDPSGASVRSAHVLLAALRAPFPSLSSALQRCRIETPLLIESLELSLADAKPSDAPPFEKLLATAAGDGGAEISPELLVRTAVENPDLAIEDLVSSLGADGAGLFSALRNLNGAEAGAPDSAVELSPESFERRVAVLLCRLQSTFPSRAIGRRDLVRALLSDAEGLLSRGLMVQGRYRELLSRLGGRLAFGDAGTRAGKVELSRCHELLREILASALAIARSFGAPAIDDASLVRALTADARADRNSELRQVRVDLEGLEDWILEESTRTARVGFVEPLQLQEILPFLRSKVINQDQAIDEVYRRIRRIRMNLLHPSAVAGVFLFVGPPGVGKSYLAKLIAQALYGYESSNPEAHLVMVECGRYKAEHDVTALLGASPGYVGMDAGVLRNGLRDKAPCVVVFDEAERMHASIWDSLLTMINDGMLRDTNGNTYSLAQSIIVLTSNKGIQEAEDYRRKKIMGDHAAADALVSEAQTRLGERSQAAAKGPATVQSGDEFWSHPDYRENYKAILLSRAREHFGPAMYARINEKIGFNGLRRVDYERIAEQEVRAIAELVQREYGVTLRYGPELPKALAGANSAQIDADARAIRNVADRYLLDEFAATVEACAGDVSPVYDVKVVPRGRPQSGILDRLELTPATTVDGQASQNQSESSRVDS